MENWWGGSVLLPLLTHRSWFVSSLNETCDWIPVHINFPRTALFQKWFHETGIAVYSWRFVYFVDIDAPVPVLPGTGTKHTSIKYTVIIKPITECIIKEVINGPEKVSKVCFFLLLWYNNPFVPFSYVFPARPERCFLALPPLEQTVWSSAILQITSNEF